MQERVYVISYKDPSNLGQIGNFVDLPSGHTSTCIDDCRYIWTRGPARRNDQDWLGPIFTTTNPPSPEPPRLIGNGRPIWVTDLTNPENPKVSDQPIDLWRNDKYTDYSHDVNVDDQGIAWISGRGGIRGYATKGRWRDPYQNRVREASPFDPILVAGGGVAGTRQPAMFMRDFVAADRRLRPRGGRRERKRHDRDGGGLRGAVRADPGHVVFSDLSDSWGEEASQSTVERPSRMKALGAYDPFPASGPPEGVEPGPPGN